MNKKIPLLFIVCALFPKTSLANEFRESLKLTSALTLFNVVLILLYKKTSEVEKIKNAFASISDFKEKLNLLVKLMSKDFLETLSVSQKKILREKLESCILLERGKK